MSVKYLKIKLSIHGLDITDKEAIDFLLGWIKESTRAVLRGNSKKLFNFRDENDIEVECEVIYDDLFDASKWNAGFIGYVEEE